MISTTTTTQQGSIKVHQLRINKRVRKNVISQNNKAKAISLLDDPHLAYRKKIFEVFFVRCKILNGRKKNLYLLGNYQNAYRTSNAISDKFLTNSSRSLIIVVLVKSKRK